jgi:putative endonuclease
MTPRQASGGVRQVAERTGRSAETLCVWWLVLRGWRILARRSRHPVGEIDIVAVRRSVVAFIEVKARRDVATAAESIAARQQERIARAAHAFLQRQPHLAAHDQRFDVMLVAPWRLPVHIPNAWHILR